MENKLVKQARQFVSWCETFYELRNLYAKDETLLWQTNVQNINDYIQKKILSLMPANNDELDVLLEAFKYNYFFYDAKATVDNFWRALEGKIVSFQGFENKVLNLALPELEHKHSSVKTCFLVLSREEMILFYSKEYSKTFEKIVLQTISLREYSLENAILPNFFVKIAPILQEKYPNLFQTVKSKIPELLQIWIKDANRSNASIGSPLLIEDKWMYFDDAFQKKLSDLYI